MTLENVQELNTKFLNTYRSRIQRRERDENGYKRFSYLSKAIMQPLLQDRQKYVCTMHKSYGILKKNGKGCEASASSFASEII